MRSPRGDVEPEFVVPAPEILDEGVPGDDRLSGVVGMESALRSEPLFELAVIGLDPVVGVAFDVMPRRWDQTHRTVGYTAPRQ
jgi:hypothetical protein